MPTLWACKSLPLSHTYVHKCLGSYCLQTSAFIRRTPLIVCVISDQMEICKFLIENNAQLELLDKDGMTALSVAVFLGRLEICRLLIENNAKIDVVNIYGK